MDFPFGDPFYYLIKKSNLGTFQKNPFPIIFKKLDLNFYHKFHFANLKLLIKNLSFHKWNSDVISLCINATDLVFCILTNFRSRNIDTIVCMSFFTGI